MKHLKAMERRAIKLWGEATGKTIPLRMKKICMYNVSQMPFRNVLNCFEMHGLYSIVVVVILFQLPMFLNAVINLFKMILPKKLTDRLVMVGSDKTK